MSVKFYYPDGDEIAGENSRKEFLNFYNRVYYYLYRDSVLEKTVIRILERGISSAKDVMNVLLWKTGGIESKDEKNTIIIRNKAVNAEKLWKEIKGVKDELGADRHECTRCAKCPKCVVCDVLENIMNNHDGIGPVYAITLLHFLSKGIFPIYDKFAHIALKVIFDEKHDFNTLLITDKELSKEFNTKDAETISESYQKYRFALNRLEKVFYDVDKKDKRTIDRALWVYGHLFNENNKNKQRLGSKSSSQKGSETEAL